MRPPQCCGVLCGALDGGGFEPLPCCCSCRILCWIAANFCSCSGVRIALILGLPSCRICITFCCFCSRLMELSLRTDSICLFSSSTMDAIFTFWSGVSCSSSSTVRAPPCDAPLCGFCELFGCGATVLGAVDCGGGAVSCPACGLEFGVASGEVFWAATVRLSASPMVISHNTNGNWDVFGYRILLLVDEWAGDS